RVAPALGAQPLHVLLPALVLLAGQLPGEVEERPNALVDGRRAVIALHGLSERRIARLGAKPRRVGLDSVVAAIRDRDDGRDHLPLGPAQLGPTAHQRRAA